MDIFKALDFFKLYTGLEQSQAVKWLPLIASAKAQITHRLRSAEKEENGDRLAEAAAALAFYKYTITKASNEDLSFKAGSVSVSCADSKKIAAAKANLDAVLSSVSDLLTDDDFAFVGVSI